MGLVENHIGDAMANIRKEMKQLRARLHKTVEASDGRIIRKKGSNRYDYVVGDVKQYYIWHETLSDVNSIHLEVKNIRKLADTLKLSADARRKNEIEFIVRVHDIGDWEVFDKFTYTWFKKVRARLETEDVEQSRD